jgi:hypothetical protein
MVAYHHAAAGGGRLLLALEHRRRTVAPVGRHGYFLSPAGTDALAAVIFRGIKLSGSKLASPDGDEVRGAITQLAQRVFLREPSDAEMTRYIQLARDIEATGNAEPARAWMQAVCFAVFSSAEAVFY